MNRRRTFVCEDCGDTVTRYRQSGEPLICARCGQARLDAHNATLKELGARLQAENRARRVKQPRPARSPAPAVEPPVELPPLTGRGYSLSEAFTDLNRQERDRAAGLLDSP